ncbi:unnamed protein product [Cochlearia groenlandica]
MQSPSMEEKEEMKKRKSPWMKETQLVEFQMQALVYKYIEAGLRVPHHLLVPIWNSLIHQNHHSSSRKYIEFLKMLSDNKVEPEPTRCRRTDGKKWRCRKPVLLFEKYCERHMHRGRKRSRKLVESSSFDVVSSSALTKDNKTCALDGRNESRAVFHGKMSVSSNAQVVTIASLPSTRVCDNMTRPSLVVTEPTKKSVSHGDMSRRTIEMSYDDCIKQRDDEKLPSIQKFFPEESDISLEAAKFSSNKKIKNVKGGLFPGFYFSPDTVLQDRGGFRLDRVETDNKPGRCLRTDGKKWRCSKDAISDQKYCGKHMHRGIKKKHPVDSNSHENARNSPLNVKAAARSMSCEDGEGQNLSVTALGVPLSRVSDEKSTSGCSTDTTITDIALKGEEDNEEVLSLCSSVV